MEIEEINNKEIWENFLLECEEKTFLNSWNWGEFQKKQSEKQQAKIINTQMIGQFPKKRQEDIDERKNRSHFEIKKIQNNQRENNQCQGVNKD